MPRGLTPEEHEELNNPTASYPGGKEAKDKRMAELRAIYVNDEVALQQINVYATGSDYHVQLSRYSQALMSNNQELIKELEAWFKQHYPEIK